MSLVVCKRSRVNLNPNGSVPHTPSPALQMAPQSSLSKKSATSCLLTSRETKPLPFIANTSRFRSNPKRLFRAGCFPSSVKKIQCQPRSLSPSFPSGQWNCYSATAGWIEVKSCVKEARVRPPALVMPSCGCFLFGKINSGPGVL